MFYSVLERKTALDTPCVFYIYPRLPNTTVWQSTEYVIDMALLLHLGGSVV